MERVNRVYSHPLYQQHFQAIQSAEADRIFCRHTMEHFLDVARMMYIYSLEEQADLPKELIYTTALLHDIGRYEQIAHGIGHHEAGADLAERILTECEYSQSEINQICDAILHHRKGDGAESPLAVYLYRADKASRCCFSCSAEEECNWSEEKKNLMIKL